MRSELSVFHHVPPYSVIFTYFHHRIKNLQYRILCSIWRGPDIDFVCLYLYDLVCKHASAHVSTLSLSFFDPSNGGWCVACPCHQHFEPEWFERIALCQTLQRRASHQSSSIFTRFGVFVWRRQQSFVQSQARCLHSALQERRQWFDTQRLWSPKADAAVSVQSVSTAVHQHTQDLEHPSQRHSDTGCPFVGSSIEGCSQATPRHRIGHQGPDVFCVVLSKWLCPKRCPKHVGTCLDSHGFPHSQGHSCRTMLI